MLIGFEPLGRSKTKMNQPRSYQEAPRATLRAVRNAFLLGFVSFGLLWILFTPFRNFYVPSEEDLPVLADSLLLAPDASWLNWFTRGYSDFWDLYPDSPAQGSEATARAFTRPAFQLMIYLAHFLLGKDWASYQLINCLAVAGIGALAFLIARVVLGLRAGPSLIATVLVVLSPPVLNCWLSGIAFASEPLATVIVACAFLAGLARRDFLCLGLLILALLTKETSMWASFAAAITIMLRPKPHESLQHRSFTAAAMLLPMAIWLGFRFTFFGGIGGTYATAGYTPLVDFLKLSLHKVIHVHDLFITRSIGPRSETGNALGVMLNWVTALLIYPLLLLWALRILPERMKRYATYQVRTPTIDGVFLVALWAGIALAFYLAIPAPTDRYAIYIMVFAWPGLLAEVERRDKAIIWLGLAVSCVIALARSSHYFFVEPIADPFRNNWQKRIASMGAELRRVPSGTRQVYVLAAGGLENANPKYVRLALGMTAEIVRVAEIEWNCHEASDLVAFDHSSADGVVRMNITLPTCANFQFYTDRFNNHFANGRLYRNDTLSYELSDAYLLSHTTPWRPSFYLGRRMTVNVRPSGPARFVIEHGGHNGIAWFDSP